MNMMVFKIIFLFYLTIINATSNNNLKNTKRRLNTGNIHNKLLKYKEDNNDAVQAAIRANILQQARKQEHRLNNGQDIPIFKSIPGGNKFGKEYYHMDPVLNHVRRTAGKLTTEFVYSSKNEYSSESSESARDWKEEFNEQRMLKKMEAINSTFLPNNNPYMVAAKPWGIPCGDPQQSHLPWGSCMLYAECDAEFRIYRGDVACGRSNFVCCALQKVNYDLYQGFDVSFVDTEASSSQDEKRGSREIRKRKKYFEKRKRLKAKSRRKRQMKKSIRRIARLLRKILNRAYRNSTRYANQRALFLHKYITALKSKYKDERKIIKGIHAVDLDEINTALENKLQQIGGLNTAYLTNATFRHIILNRNLTKDGPELFVDKHPFMSDILTAMLRRRQGGGEADKGSAKEGQSYEELEYTLYIKQ